MTFWFQLVGHPATITVISRSKAASETLYHSTGTKGWEAAVITSTANEPFTVRYSKFPNGLVRYN